MHKESFERTRTYEDRLDIVTLDTSVAIDYRPGEMSHQSFFVPLDEFKKAREKEKKKNIFHVALSIENKYYWFSNEFWDLVDKEGFATSHKSNIWELLDSPIRSLDAINLNNFNEENLARFDGSANLLYKLGNKNPFSIPYYISYISGVTNKEFDLNKAEVVLRESPYVSRINKIEIPYYNRDAGNYAIEFFIRLPQNIYDKLCGYYRDEKKAKYWSVDVHDALVWKSWIENESIDMDFIGLKGCRKSPEKYPNPSDWDDYLSWPQKI